jgi:hypothetical protein
MGKTYHELTEHVLQDVWVHLADFTLSMEDHLFKECVLVLSQLFFRHKYSTVAEHHEGVFVLKG